MAAAAAAFLLILAAGGVATLGQRMWSRDSEVLAVVAGAASAGLMGLAIFTALLAAWT